MVLLNQRLEVIISEELFCTEKRMRKRFSYTVGISEYINPAASEVEEIAPSSFSHFSISPAMLESDVNLYGPDR